MVLFLLLVVVLPAQHCGRWPIIMLCQQEFKNGFEAGFAANRAWVSIENRLGRMTSNRCKAAKYRFLLRYNRGLIPHYSYFKPVLEGLS